MAEWKGKDTYRSQGGTTPALELRESLLSILKDISPNEDNYFISNFGVAPPAMNTLHEWNLFHEDRASSVSGNAEGDVTTYTDLQVEERSNNRTVILDSPVRLSRTRASIANVTGEDAMGVEKERALRRLKSEMEYATVMGTIDAGQTDTARGMAGIDACISTNVTARDSGQSFTETELNDIVQDSWDTVGASYVMDLLAAPVVIKRRIASFGANLTRNVEAYDKKLTQEVRVYDSEVGQTVKIIAHKDVRKTAGTLTVLGIREDLFEHSFLINSGEPHWEERAVDGDRENGVYITEFTLVSYNEHAHVKRTGYNSGL
jgi:hypothetical protein